MAHEETTLLRQCMAMYGIPLKQPWRNWSASSSSGRDWYLLCAML